MFGSRIKWRPLGARNTTPKPATVPASSPAAPAAPAPALPVSVYERVEQTCAEIRRLESELQKAHEAREQWVKILQSEIATSQGLIALIERENAA